MKKIIALMLLIHLFIHPMSKKGQLTWDLEELIRESDFYHLNLNEITTLDRVNNLLHQGANPDFALVLAAAKINSRLVVETLLAHGADPSRKFDEAFPYFALFGARDASMARILIDAGAQVNMKNPCGETALISGAGNKSLGLVRLLLEHGADPDIQSDTGDTALIAATESKIDKSEIVEQLLKYGANPNLQTTIGRRTALMNASLKGHPWSVAYLVRAGANLLQTNKNGESALQIAHEQLEIADTDELRAEYLAIIEMLNNPHIIQRSGLKKLT